MASLVLPDQQPDDEAREERREDGPERVLPDVNFALFLPVLGAGAGFGRYSFQQTGDFVDFVDNRVFPDVFRSEGWAPLVQAFGGTDIQVMSRMLLSFEARYTWSHADLDQDFVGFDPIDLGGLRFGGGIHFIF